MRLTPRSSKTKVDGVGVTAEGPAVLARVNAVPEDNAANKALTDLVAAWLGCSKSAVTLVSGAKSRVKTVAVSGDPAKIEPNLEARLAALAANGT